MQSEMLPGLVSVALCVRNARDTIVKAVQSILDQSYEHLELFVVDDQSDDGSADLVRTQIQDPRVTLIRLEKNIGTYAAKNLVLRHFTQGEFFALQDADDFSLPRRFVVQIKFIQEHQLAACGTCIDEFFSDPAITPRFSKDIPAQFDEKDGYYHKINLYPERFDWFTLYDPAIPIPDLKIAMNGSLMFRTEAITSLGGFEGRTPVAADTDLLLRLIGFYSFGNVQEVLYSRRFHPRSLTASDATGFQSSLRQRFVDATDRRRAELRHFLLAGKRDEAWAVARCDMYYPHIAFEYQPLGRCI